jgi:hypothetical protein
MRAVPLIATLLFSFGSTFAGEIRQFDLETTKRLGQELAQVSQRPDRGATNSIRKCAIETAKAALQGKLFKGVQYEYVVLDDPDGSGFLVYALARSGDKVVLGGHFRVTVSLDGAMAKRVDALSNTLLLAPPPPKGFEGKKPLTVSMSQIVSDKPLETAVYVSLHDKVMVFVGMMDGTVWSVIGDQIFKMTPEMMKQMENESKKEKKK